MKLIFFSIKIELSDFRLSAQISAKVPDRRFFRALKASIKYFPSLDHCSFRVD